MGKNNRFVSDKGKVVGDRKAPKMTAQERTIYELYQRVNALENFITRELLNDMGQVRNLLFAYLRLNIKPNDLAPEAVKYPANEAYSKNLTLRCDELVAKHIKEDPESLGINVSEEAKKTINDSAAGLTAMLAEDEGATMADENQAQEAEDTEKTEAAETAEAGVDQAKVDADDSAKADEAAGTESGEKAEDDEEEA